ncbi:hypothetical protein PIB30_000464 [Stylosanthes scabra]|uniref:Uncharacterized protein n=1 Tax=Stylosanthes scabra TaxID=79078 RepID=A0ABU6V4Q3_9FABA|nr:hypothetical protein [Stylosanthes scabra]
MNKFSGNIPAWAPIMFTQVTTLPILSSMKFLLRSMKASLNDASITVFLTSTPHVPGSPPSLNSLCAH